MSDPVFYMFISFILNVVVHITMFLVLLFRHFITLHVRFWNCACHFLPYYPFSTLKKMVHESGSLLSQMNLVRKKITMGMGGVRLKTKLI